MSFNLFNWNLSIFLAQPTSREEEEEVGGLLAALVVCLLGLVPVAVYQYSIHLLHPVIRL